MKKIQLLDCTLRDGGFVNDWNFGFGSIKSIISRLGCARIDIIEAGFIDERREYDKNRSIFPNTDSIIPIFSNIKKTNSSIVAMIDYGTCSLQNVSEQNKSCLDGIRVIFKKKDQDGALKFLSALKDKGYKIFVNPVSITSYNDDELKILIDKINKISPNAVSIVDTYGLMHSKESMRYFSIYDKYLNDNITLGYHSHNNFQMAYANSIFLLNSKSNRNMIVDGSLYGMGKNAGNACTELLAMHINELTEERYDINQIQEAIDVDILKEYQKYQWGYNFEYYIAALNDKHPSYIKNLLDKRTLSIKSVNEILQKIDKENSLTYNKDLIEKLYNNYQSKFKDDSADISELKKIFEKRPLLLIGPGTSIDEYKEKISQFITETKPITVFVNFLSDYFNADYVFFGNAKRYSQFFDKLYSNNLDVKIICSSNITEAGEKIDFIVNYSSLLSENKNIRDNPLVMFLRLLSKIETKNIYLAGFDGFSEDMHKNYYGEYRQFLYCDENVVLRNEAIKKEISTLSSNINIQSITPTRYL